MEYKKICADCGFNVDFEAKFCPNCGSNTFRALEETEETTLLTPEDSPFNQNGCQNTTAEQQGNYQNMSNPAQPYQMPVNPQPPVKKKNSKSKIIVLVLAIFIFLVTTGTIVEKSAQKKGFGSSENNIYDNTYYSENGENDDLYDDAITYTKGRIEDDYYINEWADIKFKISDEFYDISDAHENYESLTEECGFAFVNELEAKQVVLVFEDLSAYSYVDAKQYLSACEKNITESFSNVECILGDNKEGTITIAGKEYLTFNQSMVNPNGASLELKLCARIQGERAIVFMLMDQDVSVINSFVDNIESVY